MQYLKLTLKFWTLQQRKTLRLIVSLLKVPKKKPFVHLPVVLINFKSVREKLIVQKCVRDKKLKTE